ncbi:hypothetical protein ACA910_014290 [Epithemia clementina (nom. ined.)]
MEGILTSFFSVPKGDQDIHMVYEGTKSGVNAGVFAPWFALATVDTMLKLVDVITWSADSNFGEVFLNFWLHPELRRYAGIKLTGLFPDKLPDYTDLRRKEDPIKHRKTI